ncbi:MULTISPECIES: hypothetical protein [unclassified Saccharothrix]|uniref:hypothetical protein n=1 Tax=unclassified Saccharothrix TaxID=2593673 RepID=UPI00307D97F8
MTEPVPRPKRPPALIAALVMLPLAALLFGMTATNLGGSSGPNTTLPSLTLLISLFAIRFTGARTASVVLLAFLTVLWLPGAIASVGDPRVDTEPVAYTLLGTALFVVGAVLVYRPASNQYYRQAAQWRDSLKRRPTTR